MLQLKLNLLLFYFLFIFLIQIKSTLNEEIVVTAKNHGLVKCEQGLYFIEMNVDFSSPFEEYYTFPLHLENPPEIKLKCIMSYQNKSILCFANLNSNKFYLEIGEFLKLPQKFPKLENIIWDYDSFVKNIYEKEWAMKEDCLEINYKNYFGNEWGLVFDIKKIYENKCSYSVNAEDNKYMFKMKANILEGKLMNEIEKINEHDSFIIEPFQEIWIPILINGRRGRYQTYKKINDFSFAFCSINDKISIISKNNIDYIKNNGLDFDCYITIPEGKLLLGTIKIEPFYDYLYLKINENNEKENKIIFEKFYFNINRTIEMEYNTFENSFEHQQNMFVNNFLRRNNENDNKTSIPEKNIDKNDTFNNTIAKSSKEDNKKDSIDTTTEYKTDKNEKEDNNLINNTVIKNDTKDNKSNQKTANITENKNSNNNTLFNSTFIQKRNITINYFIIGEKDKIYCPDRPVFVIADSSKEIVLLSSQEKEYTIMLKGTLTNNIKQPEENAYFSLVEVYDDISFSLHLIDNLAEDEDDQKALANCTIQSGTLFFRYIPVFCHGKKISEESMLTNDTDVTLNWGLEKNRLHDDIIIKWPDEKKKIKHMYSYYIQGFSLVQTNYGCLNNEFYFYIYIYDMEIEADISFEIQMKNPEEPKAICKLYESSIIKCYFPLYKQKLEKNTRIDLPTNYTYYSVDEDGNQVIFEVDEYDYDYEDFHITVKETCGDYFIIGALKKAGFNYFKIFMIVLGIAAFVFIVFVCFVSYIYYKITHRNKKGIYVRHIEEDINSNEKFNTHQLQGKKMDIISSRKN